jgi:hypothetical protein
MVSLIETTGRELLVLGLLKQLNNATLHSFTMMSLPFHKNQVVSNLRPLQGVLKTLFTPLNCLPKSDFDRKPITEAFPMGKTPGMSSSNIIQFFRLFDLTSSMRSHENNYAKSSIASLHHNHMMHPR